MATGERIKAARKKAGLTQKVLGEKCNMPDSQIRQYELGMVNPRIEQLRRIAAALGVYISDLVDDWGNFTQDEIISDLDEDTLFKNSKQLLDKYQSMEKDDGTLDEELLEKEFDSIMEITQNTSSMNKAFYTAQIKQYMEKMSRLLLKLNTAGKEEALKRVSELARLSEYMGVDLGAILSYPDKPDEPPQD